MKKTETMETLLAQNRQGLETQKLMLDAQRQSNKEREAKIKNLRDQYLNR